jgi:hypothetical protein
VYEIKVPKIIFSEHKIESNRRAETRIVVFRDVTPWRLVGGYQRLG